MKDESEAVGLVLSWRRGCICTGAGRAAAGDERQRWFVGRGGTGRLGKSFVRVGADGGS